jgi:hypothetical protein
MVGLAFLLFVWALGSVIIGIVAWARGRWGIGWFLLSLMISPFLAIIVILLPEKEAKPVAEWSFTNYVGCTIRTAVSLVILVIVWSMLKP